MQLAQQPSPCACSISSVPEFLLIPLFFGVSFVPGGGLDLIERCTTVDSGGVDERSAWPAGGGILVGNPTSVLRLVCAQEPHDAAHVNTH